MTECDETTNVFGLLGSEYSNFPRKDVAVNAMTALFPAKEQDASALVRAPEDILQEALSHKPRKVFVGFSGGNDSLATVLWMMDHVDGCEVFHANTGVGIEATRQFVRDTCSERGWKLTEIRAKEDCGQDYDAIVRKHGFPGPKGHQFMYRRLKERAVETLVRRNKVNWRDKIMIATGIRHDESLVRAGYAGREINSKGSQLWVNPLYWWTKTDMSALIDAKNVQRNPVSLLLGMSGECLCGAYAHKGELGMVSLVCPETAARIRRLEVDVRAAGHDWGWEDKPPSDEQKFIAKHQTIMPFCINCEKNG